MRQERVKRTPVISVMMCAYNAAAYIGDAIQSTLEQTYKDFELIIVDDGSTDQTQDIIRSFTDKRIRVIKRKHDYIGSLNAGMRACKGEFIARMDADDMMMPKRLKTQLNLMRNHPELAACFSWGTTFGTVEERIGHCARGRVDHAFFWLLTGNYLMHPTAMIRASFLRCHHIHYKRYPYAEDYKLWSDITRLGGEIYIIPKSLFRYRISKSQVSYLHHSEQQESRLRIQQDILEELLTRLEEPQKSPVVRLYHMLLRMNQMSLLQGDEVIVQMYKILRRIKFNAK